MASSPLGLRGEHTKRIAYVNIKLHTYAKRDKLETRVKPVRNDPQEIARMGVVPIQAGLLAREGPWVRHDPKKLAHLIVSIADALPRPGAVYDEGGLVA